MSAATSDPRPARSRARLLEAAVTLLRAGGPSAVTVDAVTRTANVARATLYRHFPSGNDLLAAAFNSLIPASPTPPAEGSLRDRLVAVVLAQAEAVAQAPTMMTAMTWLALGRDLEAWPQPRADDSVAITTLRERIAQQYSEPFDVIFDSPEAAELGEVDRSRAIALLIGPLVLGRLSTLPDFDYRECALAAVDGFLHVQRARARAARVESAGA
ncbi:TetR family transcriptional regulator [Mycobacterium avium subsp. paratuberculosis]|nr:TetR family transcriptional regulator [Mycobacterium avium subsp. paratuberculosis]QPM73878.1 TetR/AcrR family transcriptional regulator [Mycobacterium avium subsp. paratuberculosis S397]AJK81464.1 TetR family transcriptional regulator [Mycobacterium avium subsp. paratuberculosis]ANH30684.1 TetR family transcriptional regulator [Mycobacterium avium subsp. paratuberculosis]OHW73392.1 TetR family transcriptional regulator [Mycobacterium avium subsp. paratuberculosis]